MNTFIYYGNELYHHGIKGQKWGVRRYQNEDGSLTEAGRKRYNTSGSYTRGLNSIDRQIAKTKNNLSKTSSKIDKLSMKYDNIKNSNKYFKDEKDKKIAKIEKVLNKYKDKKISELKDLENYEKATQEIISKAKNEGYTVEMVSTTRYPEMGKRIAIAAGLTTAAAVGGGIVAKNLTDEYYKKQSSDIENQRNFNNSRDNKKTDYSDEYPNRNYYGTKNEYTFELDKLSKNDRLIKDYKETYDKSTKNLAESKKELASLEKLLATKEKEGITTSETTFSAMAAAMEKRRDEINNIKEDISTVKRNIEGYQDDIIKYPKLIKERETASKDINDNINKMISNYEKEINSVTKQATDIGRNQGFNKGYDTAYNNYYYNRYAEGSQNQLDNVARKLSGSYVKTAAGIAGLGGAASGLTYALTGPKVSGTRYRVTKKKETNSKKKK